MKNNLSKIFVPAAISLLIIPHLTFAAWWNPFTWRVLNRHPEPKVENMAPALRPPVQKEKTKVRPAETENRREADSPKNKPVSTPSKTIPPVNRQSFVQIQTKGDVIDTHPIPCKPSHGFDSYRTDQTLVVDPSDSNTLYVHVEFRGTYKSTDGGKTWKSINKGLKALPRADNPKLPCYGEHFSLYIDPTNPRRLLFPGGAPPGRMSNPAFTIGGLSESLDGGESWRQLFKGEMNSYTTYVVTDGRNPNVIYVATAALAQTSYDGDPNKMLLTKGIVYKTTDGGKTWRELPTGLVPHLGSTGIFINRKNYDHLLVTTFARQGGTVAVLPEQFGVLETRDGGETWTKLESTAGVAIRFSDVSSANFDHIFLSGEKGGNEVGMYSLDGGKTFTEVRLSPSYPVNLAIYDPHDPDGNRLLGFSKYASPNDMFESLDGAKTWHSIGKLPSGITNDSRASNIVFDAKNKGTVYLNAGMGRVWKSADGGKTWLEILSLQSLPN